MSVRVIWNEAAAQRWRWCTSEPWWCDFWKCTVFECSLATQTGDDYTTASS